MSDPSVLDYYSTGLLCYIAALVTGMYVRSRPTPEPAELGAEAETAS
jgi:hypothetical protein